MVENFRRIGIVKARSFPAILKVQLISKKTFLCHRLDQKSNKNILRISALASKKSSNQKTLVYNYFKYPLISAIKCHYFFDPTSF